VPASVMTDAAVPTFGPSDKSRESSTFKPGAAGGFRSNR
jgi:hypothetical protein